MRYAYNEDFSKSCQIDHWPKHKAECRERIRIRKLGKNWRNGGEEPIQCVGPVMFGKIGGRLLRCLLEYLGVSLLLGREYDI